MPRKADIPADLFFDEPKAKPKRAIGADVDDDKTLKRDNGKSSGGRPDVGVARIGRPPMQQGAKSPVTLYLTEPVVHRLEEARFLLLSEYGVKTSKSALADYALGQALADLATVAEDLGE